MDIATKISSIPIHTASTKELSKSAQNPHEITADKALEDSGQELVRKKVTVKPSIQSQSLQLDKIELTGELMRRYADEITFVLQNSLADQDSMPPSMMMGENKLAVLEKRIKTPFTQINSEGGTSILLSGEIAATFKNLYVDVAIKVIKIKSTYNQKKIKRMCGFFTQESMILSQVKHENIVELLYSQIDTTYHNPLSYFLILRRHEMDGIDFILDNKIQNKTKKIMLLFFHIMKALQYLKENHIIHRDVKLDNCLGNEDQTHWRLSDFGSAIKEKIINNDGTHSIYIGSIGYMAPEISQRRIVYYQSDIYSWSMSILASYPVNPNRHLLHFEYYWKQYDLYSLIYNDSFTEIYTPCRKCLQLPNRDESIKKIVSQFTLDPVGIAQKLWEQEKQVFVSHPEQTREMNKSLYILLTPAILTAS
ncbi:MAG: protein kinase, partial [Endozoicomonadaceae bacterium]|nr:protein kinase [Endozoicomonadaceae bacterium]